MEAFADHFNLRPLVRFNTHVVRLDHPQHGKHTLQEGRHCCSASSSNEQKDDSRREKWAVVSRPADSAEKVRGLSPAYRLPVYLEAWSIEDSLKPSCFVSELVREM